MRFLILVLALVLGCCSNPKIAENTSQHQTNPGISLYPGYVAKSAGTILWFPTKPEFDHENTCWVGENSVEITSCIADPWPYGSGDAKSLMKIGSD